MVKDRAERHPEKEIKSRIVLTRGKRVMLDRKPVSGSVGRDRDPGSGAWGRKPTLGVGGKLPESEEGRPELNLG